MNEVLLTFWCFNNLQFDLDRWSNPAHKQAEVLLEAYLAGVVEGKPGVKGN